MLAPRVHFRKGIPPLFRAQKAKMPHQLGIASLGWLCMMVMPSPPGTSPLNSDLTLIWASLM